MKKKCINEYKIMSTVAEGHKVHSQFIHKRIPLVQSGMAIVYLTVFKYLFKLIILG